MSYDVTQQIICLVKINFLFVAQYPEFSSRCINSKFTYLCLFYKVIKNDK